MTHPKPVSSSSQTLRRRGPRSLDDLAALRGERLMIHPEPASSSLQTLGRRGPRSFDDLVVLCSERLMAHPKHAKLQLANTQGERPKAAIYAK
jgi:hypothetical protein